MFSNRESGVVIASLNHTVSVTNKPSLTRLATLSTELRLVRAGPVPLGAGDEVQYVGCGAICSSFDGQILTRVTNSN